MNAGLQYEPERRDLEAKLEPEAVAFTTCEEQRASLSAAISLKRIADGLDALGTDDGISALHRFFTNLAYDAGRVFQSGMNHNK